MIQQNAETIPPGHKKAEGYEIKRKKNIKKDRSLYELGLLQFCHSYEKYPKYFILRM